MKDINNKKLSIYHDNLEIRENLFPEKGYISAIINFKNDVGFSTFEIYSENKIKLDFTIEVFPSRMNYKKDYKKMIQDINNEIYNLAYDFMRKTHQNMEIQQKDKISPVEYFSIFDNIFDKFKTALKRIEKSFHYKLKKEYKIKNASKVKNIDNRSRKWLRKNKRYYSKKQQLPEKILTPIKYVSLNTLENKFIKHVLKKTIKSLNDFKDKYNEFYNENSDKRITDQIEKYINTLNRFLEYSFLKKVYDINKKIRFSHVLQMAPGYKDVYKYYLMLKKGLSLKGGVFNLSNKQTWQLYEYWCFIKLCSILRTNYNLIDNDFIKIDYSGIKFTLDKSKKSNISFKNDLTGEKYSLTYNSYQGEKITTNQRPDYIFSLDKKNSNVNYRFVFDAKYSIDTTKEYKEKYGSYGPKETNINAMHRYRDAILYKDKEKLSKTVIGAYVLFPFEKEKSFKENRFYKSIKEVNIGAFPFLPGTTNLVKKFLNDLIEENMLTSFERNILPVGLKEYQNRNSFKKNVLIGSLRKREKEKDKSQLKFCLERKYYYLPKKRIGNLSSDLEYVAIYHSKDEDKKYENGIKYFGKIKDIGFVKREEIDFPMSRNNPNDLYYILNVDKWKQLDQVISPEGYGVSRFMYTNYELMLIADTLPELNVDSVKQWKLWLQLKRIKEKLKIKLTNKFISKKTTLTNIKFGSIDIDIKNDLIFIDGEEIDVNIEEIMKNTRMVFNKLIKLEG